MDATQFGLRNFLSVEDVKNAPSNEWVITNVTSVTVQYKDKEPQDRLQILVDNGKMSKMWTLNRSNVDNLIKLFGKETDQWIGKKIKLGIVKVMVSGAMKDSIMVLVDEKDASGKEISIKDLVKDNA